VSDCQQAVVGLALKTAVANYGLESAMQLFEARILLESGLAALAAERGKEEHHAGMAEEVAEMFATLANPSEYLIHDLLFHRIIAQASGNPILAAIMETVTSSMYDQRRKTVERYRPSRICGNASRDLSRDSGTQAGRCAQADGTASEARSNCPGLGTSSGRAPSRCRKGQQEHRCFQPIAQLSLIGNASHCLQHHCAAGPSRIFISDPNRR